MQLLESYFRAVFDSNDLLQTWRKRAWDRLQELGLPQKNQEAFQYVPLHEALFPKAACCPSPSNSIPPMSVCFENGFFQGSNLPSAVVCLPLNAAMRTYGAFLQNRFLRSLKDETDPLAVLNGALHGSGAFLYVPPHVHIAEPIAIDHLFSSADLAIAHLQVFLGKGASISLVQKSECRTELPFGNIRVDFSLDEGASLFFGDNLQLSKKGVCFETFRCTLKKDSRLHLFSSAGGSKLSRSSIKVQLLEENSSALLQGLWKLEGKEHSHTHVTVEHAAPHCTSRQHFKGVLKDESSSSFEGKILVLPVAQKTQAYQLNNNLLWSDAASANAKPNLEIFADDVKASHGATITQLSEEDLFYFQSRGCPREEAKELLMQGFCEEILQSAPPFFQTLLKGG